MHVDVKNERGRNLNFADKLRECFHHSIAPLCHLVAAAAAAAGGIFCLMFVPL